MITQKIVVEQKKQIVVAKRITTFEKQRKIVVVELNKLDKYNARKRRFDYLTNDNFKKKRKSLITKTKINVITIET